MKTRKTMYWDLSSSGNMQAIGDRMKSMTSVSEHPFDEVALLSHSPEHTLRTFRRLREQGWEFFNSAEDVVTTHPFSTSYGVTYYFLRRERVSWRIELMEIGEGLSPLHHALVQQVELLGSRFLPVVHFSYKLPDMAAYEASLETLRRRTFHGQSCDSSYGVFSYWNGMAEQGLAEVYIKPRVNLRDQAVKA